MKEIYIYGTGSKAIRYDKIVIISSNTEEINGILAQYNSIGTNIDDIPALKSQLTAYNNLQDQIRQQTNTHIPKVPLSVKYIQGSQLITNR